MEPKIVSLPEMQVIGKGIRTSNENGRSVAEQAALWQQFFSAPFLNDIGVLTTPGVILGVYTEYEKDATRPYTYLIGAAVNDAPQIPAGLSLITIPASRYAVFTSPRGPVAQVVGETWRHIWAWSEAQGTGPSCQRSFSGDFEVYDQRCNDPHQAQVDIYIAIR